MRNTTTTTTAVAVVLLALTACADAIPAPDMDAPEAPEVTAALDWAEAADMEFGAAPFSPPGWPYRIGDEIPEDDARQLLKRYPDFFGIKAVNWVNGRAFGAQFIEPGRTYESITYLGHFPKKVDRARYESWRRRGMPVEMPLPPGGNVDLALGDRFEQSQGAVLDSLDVLRARWHEPFRSRYGKDGKR